MEKSKPFGLIISKRTQSFKPPTSAVFGSDSDDEKAPKGKMPTIPQTKSKKKVLTEKHEDPSIFEYDTIYDDMKAKESAKVAPENSSKPSRYINSLLKAADKRKKDHERRTEKKVQHERELEGDKFAGKEAFVTSAYKRKMEEMEAEEERERRENMLNEMMDVTKQKDLSGFYRHFLKQSVGEESVPMYGERHSLKREEGEKSIKQEQFSDEENSSTKAHLQEREATISSNAKSEKIPLQKTTKGSSASKSQHTKATNVKKLKTTKASPKEEISSDMDKDTDIESSSEEEQADKELKRYKFDKVHGNKKRRSYNDEQDSTDEASTFRKKKATEQSKKVHTENLDDRDSEFSEEDSRPKSKVNKSSPNKKNVKVLDKASDNLSEDDQKNSSEKESHPKAPSTKQQKEAKTSHRHIRKRVKDDSLQSDVDSSTNAETGKELPENGERSGSVEKVGKKPVVAKVDVYAKRTVGDVFADAQARYFQRMAARSA